MKFLSCLLLLLFSSPLLWGNPANRITRSEKLADSLSVIITLVTSQAHEQPEQILEKTFQAGKRIYQNLDASHSAGEVARINQRAGMGVVSISEDLLRLFRVCMQIYEWTGGQFDVVKAKPGSKIKDPQLQLNFEKREVSLPNRETYLDFHGILEGYVIDRMAGFLKAQGFDHFMIQVGQHYRTMGRDGTNYWRLNIPDPEGRGKMLCRVSLESASIVTADARDIQGAIGRVGKNPALPLDLRSVTVITKNATNATALASTALLVGKVKAREIFSHIPVEGFGALLEDREGKIVTIGDVTAACFEG